VFGIDDSKIDEAGDGLSGYAVYLRAMQNRRRYIIDHGGASSDHGTHDALTLKLDEAEADRLLAKGLAGEFTAEILLDLGTRKDTGILPTPARQERGAARGAAGASPAAAPSSADGADHAEHDGASSSAADDRGPAAR